MMLSRDFSGEHTHNPPMPINGKSDFNSDFCARTKKARKDAGYTQESIATLFEMDRDKYKQYEVRSPLPHYLIPRFCIATKVSPDWLFGWRPERQTTQRPFVAASQR